MCPAPGIFDARDKIVNNVDLVLDSKGLDSIRED